MATSRIQLLIKTRVSTSLGISENIAWHLGTTGTPQADTPDFLFGGENK